MSIREKTQSESMQPDPELGVWIRTFGMVELKNSFGALTEPRKSASHHWLLLKYLLAHRGRHVEKDALIADLCAGEEKADNALRVRMSRLRDAFSPLQLGGQHGLISSSSGYYCLNTDYILQTDADLFEHIMEKLSSIEDDDPKGLALCAQALELYEGHYLGNTESFPWLEKDRKRYYELFYQLSDSTLNRMKRRHDNFVLSLLRRRVADLVPQDDILHGKLAAYAAEQTLQVELAQFRSSTPIGGNDVYIRMFGPVELENQFGCVCEKPHVSSDTWLLLKYLLVNHGVEISQVKLMEQFWPEELTSANGDGAFRTRLSRLRKSLKPLELDGKKGLVQFSSGFYSLNPDYPIHTDADLFSSLVAKIDRTALEDPDGLTLCAAALELYRGAFLSATHDHPWLNEYRLRYRQEFCRLASSTLARMKRLDDTGILPLLSRRVLELIPEEGIFHVELISFLIEKQMKGELIPYISRLAGREGEGYEWLAPMAPAQEPPFEFRDKYDIRVRLFGLIELENQFGRAAEIKVGSLRWMILKYLLVNPGRFISADEFEEKVWANLRSSDTSIAREELRRRLREALSPLNLAGLGLVLFDDGWYGLNPKYHLITDRDVLNEKLAQLQSIPVDDEPGLDLCFEALRLFRGPFMAYTDAADWLAEHRNHYDLVFDSLVKTTLERINALGRRQDISALWQSAVSYAPGNKDLHMELLTYMVEHKLLSEVVPYICALARHDDPDTEWLNNL